MPLTATAEAVHSAIEYALATHLQAHADALRQRVLPLPFLSCVECMAIQGALGLAHQLASEPATARRARHDA